MKKLKEGFTIQMKFCVYAWIDPTIFHNIEVSV